MQSVFVCEFQLIYDHLVATTLSVQTRSGVESYCSDATLRYALYQCLLASVHSYNQEVGPLTHIACQLVVAGLQDTCPHVSY